jgi:hypothetical protein
MRKVMAVLTVVCGLTAFARPARATSIGTCVVDGSGANICDIFEDPADETGTVAPAINPGWLVGYAFLLDAADPTQKANVSDVLVIHSDHIDLFSQGAAQFDSVYGDALAGAAIDGTPIADGQVFGDTGAGPGGANRQFDPGNGAIGLFWETSNPVSGFLFFAIPGVPGGGCCDTLNIHSDADFVGGNEVPEPATLSLVAIGGAVAAYRRRRQSKSSKNV